MIGLEPRSIGKYIENMGSKLKKVVQAQARVSNGNW